jgi:CDP-diacylglycerol--glycerol-3-phosphate 3-phosphatidyltransferase
MSDSEYAHERLAGTVWDRGFGLGAYRFALGVGRRLARGGVSADSLTLASLVLAGLAGVAAAGGYFVTAAAFVLISGACDALDGIVARASGSASRFGALLDSTVDRLADGLPLLGLVVFYADGGPIAAVPAATMTGVFTVSYVRARAEALGCKLPPLFMRRAERVFVLVGTLLLGTVHAKSVGVPAPLTLAGTAILGVLSFIGAVSALRSARQVLAAPGSTAVSEPSE